MSIEKDEILIEFQPFGFKESKSHSADRNVHHLDGAKERCLHDIVSIQPIIKQFQKLSTHIDVQPQVVINTIFPLIFPRILTVLPLLLAEAVIPVPSEVMQRLI